jgi:hypothetical protein
MLRVVGCVLHLCAGAHRGNTRCIHAQRHVPVWVRRVVRCAPSTMCCIA